MIYIYISTLYNIHLRVNTESFIMDQAFDLFDRNVIINEFIIFELTSCSLHTLMLKDSGLMYYACGRYCGHQGK